VEAKAADRMSVLAATDLIPAERLGITASWRVASRNVTPSSSRTALAATLRVAGAGTPVCGKRS
jgi:hypothetical protein